MMNMASENIEKNNIKVISSWEDSVLNLKDNLLRGIYSYGFEKPSSIQKKALLPLFMVEMV